MIMMNQNGSRHIAKIKPVEQLMVHGNEYETDMEPNKGNLSMVDNHKYFSVKTKSVKPNANISNILPAPSSYQDESMLVLANSSES